MIWINLTPSVLLLMIYGCFIYNHARKPLLQIYPAIILSYLVLFPSINYIFSNIEAVNYFPHFQWLFFFCFHIPFLTALHYSAGHKNAIPENIEKLNFNLSIKLLLLLSLILFIFCFTAFQYDLFFRRIGHLNLVSYTNKTPYLLLYIYRGAIDTSFFVIAFLIFTLSKVDSRVTFFKSYFILLLAYITIFIPFYIINSRLEVIILLFSLICSQTKFYDVITKRKIRFALFVLIFIILHTLLRELVTEDTNRINLNSVLEFSTDTLNLISVRLDSMAILYRVYNNGFNFFTVDLSGIFHSFYFYCDFFFNQSAYHSIKNSLVTSPSVFIANNFLYSKEIDFPKSMVLDFFLTFGLLGLLFASLIYGYIAGLIHRNLLSSNNFSFAFILSLYLLPQILQFEKEGLTFFTNIIKWSPFIICIYILRPRLGNY